MQAIIVPNAGTIVLREDGSVMIVDRARQRYCLPAEIVEALRKLLEVAPANGEGTGK